MYIYIKIKLQTITDHVRKLVQLNEKKKNNVMAGIVLIPFSSCVTLHKLCNISETDSSFLKKKQNDYMQDGIRI